MCQYERKHAAECGRQFWKGTHTYLSAESVDDSQYSGPEEYDANFVLSPGTRSGELGVASAERETPRSLAFQPPQRG
ncbi:hypothetical protein GCM10027430_16290 [Lysobacter tyrosinilyticus]